MADVEPIFLLSLPRSGSTLLQRILAAHAEVATASEPWLLLPLLYTLRPSGVQSEYDHSAAARAVGDFAAALPGGRDAYLAHLRELVLDLYAGAAGGARYFLDKTPRYHLVAEELLALFADARVVFLWRNPLAIVASMVRAGGGRWSLHAWDVDLYRGLASLVEASRASAERSLAVRYEDLVARPLAEVERLLAYLELPRDPSVVERFREVELHGRLGDKLGSAAYEAVSGKPLEKWKDELAGPIRKAWARRYLAWIGAERLAHMGYDLEALRTELDALPSSPRRLLSDGALAAYGRYRRTRPPRQSWMREAGAGA